MNGASGGSVANTKKQPLHLRPVIKGGSHRNKPTRVRNEVNGIYFRTETV